MKMKMRIGRQHVSSQECEFAITKHQHQIHGTNFRPKKSLDLLKDQ
jgi:hypothetical protein